MTQIARKSTTVGIATLAALGLAAIQPAAAQSLTGFSGFSAPNGAATLSGSTVNLTNSVSSTAGSIWSTNKVATGSWTASFRYQDVTGLRRGIRGFRPMVSR